MSSNIKIEKICEWCANKFTTQTTVTRFCSKWCSEHSYKERMRQRKIALSNQETKLQSGNGSKWCDKDFLTPTQAADWNCVGATFRYFGRNIHIQLKVWEHSLGHKNLPDDIIVLSDFVTGTHIPCMKFA